MPPAKPKQTQTIRIEGAKEHNLKNIRVTIPRDALVVFTGVSGSGKSSLAFDTLYKEGQRRFLESLSPYARQFLGKMEKPQVDHIEGLSPAIAIEQKTVNRNPRSTVGTITELYDHFRLWMARLGTPYCPQCHLKISSLSASQIALHVFAQAHALNTNSTKNGKHGESTHNNLGPWCFIFAPMVRERKGEYRKERAEWLGNGFTRVRIDGKIHRLEEDLELARYEKHTLELLIDRMRLDANSKPRLVEGIEQALALSKGLVTIEDEHATGQLFSSLMACPHCQQAIPELEPRLFSFNAPQGACIPCNGLGERHTFSEALLMNPEQSLAKGALRCLGKKGNLPFTHFTKAMLCQAAKALCIDLKSPWQELPEDQRHIFLHGQQSKAKVPMLPLFRRPSKLLEQAKQQNWVGLVPILGTIARFAPSVMEKYQSLSPCPSCQGKRLNPWATAVRFQNQRIHTLTHMSIEEAQHFFTKVELSAQQRFIGHALLRQIQQRLAFLKDVGLGYLSLERKAGTLSGGEAQRIRLAAQVGSGLEGVLYILDEPSIGLHPADNAKLLGTLRQLRDLGNSVCVVEHDEETILSADHVLDLGPGAGELGGKLLAQGSPGQILQSKSSLSAQYLRGDKRINVPSNRRKEPKNTAITLHQVRLHNLNHLTVRFPLGVFTVVTGASGSGKSTLIHQVLKTVVRAHLGLDTSQVPATLHVQKAEGLEHIDKLIEIHQAPIGRTPRSNPATYTKAWDVVRTLFQSTPLAKTRGYKAGRFSFNVVGGRCETCQGAGIRTIEMQFLGDVQTPCEVCEGRRFNAETLNVHYKGKNIADVLEMSIEEAHGFFENIPALKRILGALCAVGMGYVRFGQPSTTLSGGEAQRVKLASELRKAASSNTLYLLDEPTTGLHFHDVQLLLHCLQTLVDQGNTVMVIEHNLDVIKTADYVIDLGPGGGVHGGKIMAQGSPEAIAKVKTSLTGQSLAPLLKPRIHKPLNQTHFHPQDQQKFLVVHGAEQNNLQNLSVSLPKNKLSVICGVSGCGKTSLLFDTIFSEGQARYVESLSTYARRFLGRLDKPHVERIEGLAPAIAIHQKTSARTPRSTVATATEIYDYLRLLYARIGRPHCPHCQQPLLRFTPSTAAKGAQTYWQGQTVLVLAPLHLPHSQWNWPLTLPRTSLKKNAPTSAKALASRTQSHTLLQHLSQQGFTRVRVTPPNGAPSVQRIEELLENLSVAPKGGGKSTDPHCPSTWNDAVRVELVVDRVRIGESTRPRLAEALETALQWGSDVACLASSTASDATPVTHPNFFTSQTACVTHGVTLQQEISTRLFSFNHHQGACTKCHGLGRAHQIDPELLLPFEEMPLLEGAMAKGWLAQRFMRKQGDARLAIEAFAKQKGISLQTPFGQLSTQQQALLLFGDHAKSHVNHPSQKGRTKGRTRKKSKAFGGLNGLALDLYFKNDPKEGAENPKAQHVLPFLGQQPCTHCNGQRLGPLPLAVRIQNLNIADFCALTVEEARNTLETWKFEGTVAKIAQAPLHEIRSRLRFLSEVGVGYLSLGREASTLSGGESQRIRLASQLGSSLVGVIYALDEPTIGLHPRDTAHLLTALKRLRDEGNTVIMIEHDPETILNADWLLEIGPGAGHLGGKLVAEGSPKAICKNEQSLTGAYLSGKKQGIMQPKPFKSQGELVVYGATENNLRHVEAHFPFGGMTVVTGVSGAGKSSLVVAVLQRGLARHLLKARSRPGRHQRIEGLEKVEKLVVIDQSPIGSTPRSIPATATGAMDKIRALFAQLPLAKTRGYRIGRFSYNVASGRCEACEGKGFQHIEMHFLADVWTPCPACQGARYNPQTLEITFKGKNIAEILNLEARQALVLFAHQPGIQRILQTMVDVGLGYLKLGQTANTLSGGEAQRIKLATELSHLNHGKTVYILDEPTTGLHMDDVAKLIVVLHRLRQQGNTVVVIEHNLEVICSADHLLDLGPEGGAGGGEVLFSGPPLAATRCPHSATGKAIAKRLRAHASMEHDGRAS